MVGINKTSAELNSIFKEKTPRVQKNGLYIFFTIKLRGRYKSLLPTRGVYKKKRVLPRLISHRQMLDKLISVFFHTRPFVFKRGFGVNVDNHNRSLRLLKLKFKNQISKFWYSDEVGMILNFALSF